MTARELAELEVLYAMEPFGDRRGDLQAASVAHAMVACWSAKAGKISVEDLALDFTPPRRQTSEEMKRAAMKATAAMGGVIR